MSSHDGYSVAGGGNAVRLQSNLNGFRCVHVSMTAQWVLHFKWA
jgi:hypothetical protein